MKTLWIILILWSSRVVHLFAQDATLARPLSTEFKGIVYSKERAYEARLNTNGYSLGVNFGTIKTYYRTNFWHLSLGRLKHPKETRIVPNTISSISGQSPRTYVFGKQNDFFALRGGYGTKRYFSEKQARNGLAVALSYEGGISLGLLKPYYLSLRRDSDGTGQFDNNFEEKYSETNKAEFLNPTFIEGPVRFSKGLDEVSIMPGIHGRAAIHFDWSAFDEVGLALEAGFMADVYARKVPILVSSRNVPYFLNAYIALQFIKRK